MSTLNQKDALSRLSVYALQSQLQIQISKKSMTLKEFGFESTDMQSWFVFQVMCFLMQRTLEMDERDGCTLDEIAWEIQDIIKNNYSLNLDSQQYHDLAKTVVIDILSNGGRSIEFVTGTEESRSVPLTYLSSPSVTRQGISQGGYRMSQDGFRIMLGTREIEENMNITVNNLIMQMMVKTHNYSGALEQARDQMDRLRIAENNIREEITRLKADVLSISAEKIEKIFSENLQVYEDARDRFKEIRQSVSLQMEDARRELQSDFLDQKVRSNLEKMNEIIRYVDSSIKVTGRIINALNEFLHTLRNELIRQMSLQTRRKRTVRKDMYEAFTSQPFCDEKLMDLFQPLFFQSPRPILSPEIFLDIKKLRADQIDEEEMYEDQADDEPLEQMQQKRREDVAKLHEITNKFLNDLLMAPGHTMDLLQFQQEHSSIRELNADLLKELLASWSMEKEIDLEDLLRQEKELDPTGLDTLYSLPLSYLQAASVNEDLRHFARLKMEKTQGQARFEIEEKQFHYTILIDNITLKLERKSL